MTNIESMTAHQLRRAAEVAEEREVNERNDALVREFGAIVDSSRNAELAQRLEAIAKVAALIDRAEKWTFRQTMTGWIRFETEQIIESLDSETVA